jgi:hypothetical protein
MIPTSRRINMQKWEYMSVSANGGKVLYINGDPQGKTTAITKIPDGQGAPVFLEKLNQWGREGWEVITCNRSETGSLFLLLKRPIA